MIFVELLQSFPTYQCLQKGVRDVFFLDLELFTKIKKDLVSTQSDVGKQEMCAKLQPKILNSMVVGARQVFNFSGK